MANEQVLIDLILKALSSLGGAAAEKTLHDCVKALRESRYYGRSYNYPQEWRPILRTGYERYLVSNWGYVRHSAKATDRILRPAPKHEYARIAVPTGVAGQTKQHMVHELVAESFILGFSLPKGWETGKEIVNHKDGDKWHPALHNLELTTQGENIKHAYSSGLRYPRLAADE